MPKRSEEKISEKSTTLTPVTVSNGNGILDVIEQVAESTKKLKEMNTDDFDEYLSKLLKMQMLKSIPQVFGNGNTEQSKGDGIDGIVRSMIMLKLFDRFLDKKEEEQPKAEEKPIEKPKKKKKSKTLKLVQMLIALKQAGYSNDEIKQMLPLLTGNPLLLLANNNGKEKENKIDEILAIIDKLKPQEKDPLEVVDKVTAIVEKLKKPEEKSENSLEAFLSTIQKAKELGLVLSPKDNLDYNLKQKMLEHELELKKMEQQTLLGAKEAELRKDEMKYNMLSKLVSNLAKGATSGLVKTETPPADDLINVRHNDHTAKIPRKLVEESQQKGTPIKCPVCNEQIVIKGGQ